MVAWGGSWVSAKWASGYEPLLTVFWRFLFTTISFVPILLWRREPLWPSRRAWGWIALSAVFFALYNFCFLWGLRSGGGGYGGVLVPTLNPVFTFLLTLAFLREPLGRAQVLGLCIGLSGGILQVLGPDLDWHAVLHPENLFFLAAAASYAALTHTGAAAQRDSSVFTYSFWLFLVSTLLIFPFALPHAPFDTAGLGGPFWANAAYLALGAGTFGTTLYFEAARRVGAARASSFAFLVPVSALLLAFFFLGEEPSWTSVVGGALSIAAVLLVQLRRG